MDPNMKPQKYWYLGFLGIIGLINIPGVYEKIMSGGSLWSLVNLLWLLWFLNFWPEADQSEAANNDACPAVSNDNTAP